MVVNYINDFRGGVLRQRIGANGDYFVFADDFVDRLFITGKITPMFFLQPESIICQTESLIAFFKSPIEFPDQTFKHAFAIELTIFQIPFSAGDYFDLPFIFIFGKGGQCFCHSFTGIFSCELIRCNPHTKFIIFETGLKIGHKDID